MGFFPATCGLPSREGVRPLGETRLLDRRPVATLQTSGKVLLPKHLAAPWNGWMAVVGSLALTHQPWGCCRESADDSRQDAKRSRRWASTASSPPERNMRKPRASHSKYLVKRELGLLSSERTDVKRRGSGEGRGQLVVQLLCQASGGPRHSPSIQAGVLGTTASPHAALASVTA